MRQRHSPDALLAGEVELTVASEPHRLPVTDVSPVDDGPDASQLAMMHSPRATPPRNRSNIPTMRRDRRRQEDVARSAAREAPRARIQPRQTTPGPGSLPRSEGTGWDAAGTPTYHGRSTPHSQGGRATPTSTSYTPGAPTGVGSAGEESQSFGLRTTITGAATRRERSESPSFGLRMKQLGRGKPEPADRPAGRNAPGRRSEAVRPTHATTQLHSPQQETKHPPLSGAAPFTPTRSPVSPVDGSTGARAVVRRLMPSRLSRKTSGPAQRAPSPPTLSTEPPPGSQSYPSPPQEESLLGEPLHSLDSDQSGRQPSMPPRLTPETLPASSKIVKRKPPPAGQAGATGRARQPSSADPSQPQPWPTLRAGNDSSIEEEPSPSFQSVMGRGRPHREFDASEQSPANSPTGATSSPMFAKSDWKRGSPRSSGNHSHTAAMDRRASLISLTKALPPLPPELVASNDRIASLRAKLESLAQRRINILRSIKQMTELMPQDSLMASDEVLKKRDVERQKVECLKEELAEVQQEEYDLGLKLHRAYKRQDRDSETEVPALWVKRVTA